MSFFKQKWLFLVLVFVSLASFAQDDKRAGDNYALVIIDMQPKFVTRGGNDQLPKNIEKVKQIIENQKKMIELAKKSNIPVVFIEYENYGSTNSELKKAAEGYDNVKYFEKNTDGFFESDNKNKSQLSDFLKTEQIGSLIITGANGGACVEASIEGSLANNYNVLAYSKGIADFNYTDFTFPYDDIYKFTPTCESCSFRELDDYETIALELATKSHKIKDENVNNADRTPAKDVPATPGSAPSSRKTKVTKE